MPVKGEKKNGIHFNREIGREDRWMVLSPPNLMIGVQMASQC